MSWFSQGGQGDDDRDLYLTQVDLAGPGCLRNLLLLLMAPAITVEVFLHYRLGFFYLLTGTVWATFFLTFFAVTTRLKDQGILILGGLFLFAALRHLVSLALIRDPVHSNSSGMPHWLWGRFVGGNL